MQEKYFQDLLNSCKMIFTGILNIVLESILYQLLANYGVFSDVQYFLYITYHQGRQKRGGWGG